jgi:hypothetical protein
MRRALLLLTLLALASPASPASAGVRQPAKAGTTIASAATYAALPACSTGGATAYTEDLDLLWVCNAITGLWLPPDVQPTAVIADYTADALPGLSVPPWTAQGAGSGAVSGGELTITSIYRYYLTDVSIALANNVGIIARVKVTTQAVVGAGFNTYMALRIGSMGGWVGIPCLALAGSTALSSAMNVYPFSSGKSDETATSESVDNAVYQWYYILYFKTGQTVRFGSLGAGPQYGGRVAHYTTFDATPANMTAVFGSHTGVNTSVWDRVILFVF